MNPMRFAEVVREADRRECWSWIWLPAVRHDSNKVLLFGALNLMLHGGHLCLLRSRSVQSLRWVLRQVQIDGVRIREARRGESIVGQTIKEVVCYLECFVRGLLLPHIDVLNLLVIHDL